LITFCISIFVIIYGSFRSLNIENDSNYSLSEKVYNEEDDCFIQTKQQQIIKSSSITNLTDSFSNRNSTTDENDFSNLQTINSKQAILIPIAASCTLLIMFFFFDSIQTIFVICTSILSIFTFSNLFSSTYKFLFKSLCTSSPFLTTLFLDKNRSILCFRNFALYELLSVVTSLCIVLLWILTGHWLLMDLMGVGFCVTFISLVRLPSLKVSILLLIGLVIYDIIWVYFSDFLFKTNVMVNVATKEADNPIDFIARKFNIQSKFSKDSPKLSLPGKLIVPSYSEQGNFSILGLGDIVIPGLLLCFVCRFDSYKKNQLLNKYAFNYSSESESQQNDSDISKESYLFHHSQSNYGLKVKPYRSSYSFKNLLDFNKISYFRCSLFGYIAGLFTATICSEVFKSAQPALLYLVPSTLLPLVILAYLKVIFVHFLRFNFS